MYSMISKENIHEIAGREAFEVRETLNLSGCRNVVICAIAVYRILVILLSFA